MAFRNGCALITIIKTQGRKYDIDTHVSKAIAPKQRAGPGMIDNRLPLLDLHRHLDGNVRLETILELAAQHGIALPADNVEGLRPHVEVDNNEPGLMAFISRFKYLNAVLVDADACRRIAFENVGDAQREGIDYVELRFSPWFMAETHGLDPRTVIEAIVDGVRAGEQATGVRTNLIGILSRTYGVETATRELECILDFADDFVALDLAGDEVRYPAGVFTSHFQRAREAGLRATIHAGEADGPASVWAAIRDLNAERIGHGFRSVEDPELVEYLVENRIGLEISLTSNVHISAVPGYAGHPARELLEAGVLMCLNTDDPAISGIDLLHEYSVAAPAAGFSSEQIRLMQADALEMAFLSAEEKQALLLAITS
jgi:adenosine deaminase